MKKESAFRRECNILGSEGRPYLAMRLRERATEELAMLKVCFNITFNMYLYVYIVHILTFLILNRKMP